MNFVWIAKGKDHIEMAEKSRASVKRFYPGANLFLYTPDRNKALKATWDQPWMVATVMLQLEHMIQHPHDTTVFLDNDIVMVNPMPELPNEADMWVTWRDNVGALSDPVRDLR